MKKLILAILLLPMFAYATITAEQEFALNRLSGVAKKYSLGTLIHKNVNVAVGKYSYAKQGGAVGDITLRSDLNDSASSVVIPDNAIIQDVLIDVLTTPTTNSGGTLALKAQSSGDLKGATAAASFAGLMDGVPVGSAATSIKLTADRTLKLTVASAVLTGGIFNVYVEYLLGD